MWTLTHIHDALTRDVGDSVLSSDQLAINLFDEQKNIGLGVDNLGRKVLILPGAENLSSFETKYASYDSWVDVVWLDKKIKIPNVSTLRCVVAIDDKELLKTVSGIFMGLINLELDFGSGGQSIWDMRNLFENGFKSDFTEESLLGLIGELIYIYSRQDREQIIQIWHSNAFANFDFSDSDSRIEVKSTRSNLRNHQFSSNQIGLDLDSKTQVVSLLIREVEFGCNLSKLIDLIQSGLSKKSAEKLMNVVVSTINCLPLFASSFSFDLESSASSLRTFSAVDIPRPTASAGVISMTWTANLDRLLEI